MSTGRAGVRLGQVFHGSRGAVVDEAGIAPLHPGALGLARVEHGPVPAVQHREHALYVEVAQPAVEGGGTHVLVLGHGDPHRIALRDPVQRGAPALERLLPAHAEQRVMQHDDVVGVGADPAGDAVPGVPVEDVVRRQRVLEKAQVLRRRRPHRLGLGVQVEHEPVTRRRVDGGAGPRGAAPPHPRGGRRLDRRHHAVASRSAWRSTQASMRSRFALVHSTVRRSPSSRPTAASKPSSWRDFAVLPKRRPA